MEVWTGRDGSVNGWDWRRARHEKLHFDNYEQRRKLELGVCIRLTQDKDTVDEISSTEWLYDPIIRSTTNEYRRTKKTKI